MIKVINEGIKLPKVTRQQIDNARWDGNPYDNYFETKDEKLQAITQYEKAITKAEKALDNKVQQYDHSYSGWHEDKERIGYMYDRLSLMKSSKLKSPLSNEQKSELHTLVVNYYNTYLKDSDDKPIEHVWLEIDDDRENVVFTLSMFDRKEYRIPLSKLNFNI